MWRRSCRHRGDDEPVNISTMTALVVAAAGAPVIKHSNRPRPARPDRRCARGSGDRIECGQSPPASGGRDRVLFAPAFHPALRFAGPPSRIRSAHGLALLTAGQPGAPRAVARGVRESRIDRDGAGLADRAVRDRRSGRHGLDEISTTTTTRVWDATGAELQEVVLDPREAVVGACRRVAR